jgi:hypothetical protein
MCLSVVSSHLFRISVFGSQLQNLPQRGAKDARGMGIGPFLALSALFRGYSNYLSDFGFPALPGCGFALTAALRIS